MACCMADLRAYSRAELLAVLWDLSLAGRLVGLSAEWWACRKVGQRVLVKEKMKAAPWDSGSAD